MSILPTAAFRRATPADLDAVRTLWPHLTLQEAHQRLSQRHRWIALGAWDGAWVAGGELVRCGRIVEIANVIVLPDWRRRGLGTALIDHLCAVARRLRVRRVQLTVDRANPAAVRLYTRAGFAAVGTLETLSSALLVMEKPL